MVGIPVELMAIYPHRIDSEGFGGRSLVVLNNPNRFCEHSSSIPGIVKTLLELEYTHRNMQVNSILSVERIVTFQSFQQERLRFLTIAQGK